MFSGQNFIHVRSLKLLGRLHNMHPFLILQENTTNFLSGRRSSINEVHDSEVLLTYFRSSSNHQGQLSSHLSLQAGPSQSNIAPVQPGRRRRKRSKSASAQPGRSHDSASVQPCHNHDSASVQLSHSQSNSGSWSAQPGRRQRRQSKSASDHSQSNSASVQPGHSHTAHQSSLVRVSLTVDHGQFSLVADSADSQKVHQSSPVTVSLTVHQSNLVTDSLTVH